jgi:Protein of unknown function (DUF2877)
VIDAAAWPLRPVAIGAVAHAALGRSGGAARLLAPMTSSAYATAAGQIVWLGTATASRHARAILLAGDAIPVADAWMSGIDTFRVTTEGLSPWRPRRVRVDAGVARLLLGGWRRLSDDLPFLGLPLGFGVRLAGRTPGWPLDRAATAAGALARACARDDALAASGSAVALLGVGDGLTPSGDDFVGGVLFARRLLAEAGTADRGAWRRATLTILAVASSRTHPISAALLGDLAGGSGWEPLHDLVAALAGVSADSALDAARRLVRLGHSSGWDLLAGFGAGLGMLA